MPKDCHLAAHYAKKMQDGAKDKKEISPLFIYDWASD
jgi:hypothetical protein